VFVDLKRKKTYILFECLIGMVGKQLRKTLGAPPPPPPPPTSPALVSEHDSSSLNDSGSVELNMSSTPPSATATSHKVDHPLANSEALSAAENLTKCELIPLSHSLPRPIARKSEGGSSKVCNWLCFVDQ